MSTILTMAGAVTTLVGSLLIGSGASSVVATDPPPDKIVIDLITVNGSGCPAGTAAVATAPDNTAYTVYSSYLAQVGVGATPTDFRKNCQLNIVVHAPSGFTYAIASTDYRGFGHLEAGATGVQKANYYFQGSPITASISHTFRGPLDDDWQATDRTELASLVFAPCGELRNFNINTELRVSAGTSNPLTTTSFLTMDSTDSAISTIYHFAWRTCP
jgi:hypothetical protein